MALKSERANSISLGLLVKRLFGYSFQPRDGSAIIALRARDLDPGLRAAAKAVAGGVRTWAVLDQDRRIFGVFSGLRDLPDELLFSNIAKLADMVRGLQKKEKSVGDEELFEELIGDDRIDDAAKLAVISVKGSAERLARCIALAPSSLYSGIRKVLDLDSRWKAIDRDLDDCIVKISEAVLEVVELEALKETRSALILAREDERLRREAEEREKKKLQEERAAAFRRALEEMRSPSDTAAIEMNDAFQEVFERVEKGEKFLFVTGKPGTGKSTLICALQRRLSSTSVTVLSFTGLAALAVGGQTINSFFQFPFGILDEGYVTTGYSFKRKALAMEVLVIDEVSMVRADMLDAIDSSLQAVRADGRPFGGVRVVLVGDLYQLPPVIDRDEAVVEHYRKRFGERRFFDAAKVVATLPPRLIELDKVYRQKDLDFLEFLRRVRDGSISGEELDAFNEKVKSFPPFGSSDFNVVVSPHNATADANNERMLAQLPGEAFHYAAVMEGKTDKIEKNPPVQKDLVLKRGAQVMFVKNDKGKRWMNGDIGMIEDLGNAAIRVRCRHGVFDVGPEAWPIVEYDLDKDTNKLVSREVGSFVQYPVKLAWAATIHKMQGQTVDRITIDLAGGVFETGMTYVALSRCRTVEGIRLTRPLTKADLAVDDTVRDFLDGLKT